MATVAGTAPTRARSIILASHEGAGDQVFGPFSAAVPWDLAGNWMESDTPTLPGAINRAVCLMCWCIWCVDLFVLTDSSVCYLPLPGEALKAFPWSAVVLDLLTACSPVARLFLQSPAHARCPLHLETCHSPLTVSSLFHSSLHFDISTPAFQFSCFWPSLSPCPISSVSCVCTSCGIGVFLRIFFWNVCFCA